MFSAKASNWVYFQRRGPKGKDNESSEENSSISGYNPFDSVACCPIVHPSIVSLRFFATCTFYVVYHLPGQGSMSVSLSVNLRKSNLLFRQTHSLSAINIAGRRGHRHQ